MEPGEAPLQEEPPDSWAGFYWSEVRTIVAMGWPMFVSFFCRMGMASEDSAFVGHLFRRGEQLGGAYPGTLGRGLVATAVHYAFIAGLPETGEGPTHGHSPSDYLAAAGLSDMVVNILIVPPLAFNRSLSALVSQAMGSGQKRMAGTWLQLSIIWLSVTHIPVLVAFFFVGPILRALGFSEDLCDLAQSYSKWNALWPIPNGLYQCMRFYFQAQGITRPAMYNNLVFLAVNALLDWLLVFGGPFQTWFGWKGFGFVGAAIALSISRCLQPVFYFLYMFSYRRAHLETWPKWRSRSFARREHIRSFMEMSLPQVGTMLFQAAIGQSTTLLIARLGKLAIAGSAAVSAAAMVFVGGFQPTLSMVTCIRVGFYLGRGEPLRASRVARLCLVAGTAVTGLMCLALLILQRPVIGAVTSDSGAASTGLSLLPAVLLNVVAGVVVQCGTSGILTSQGRTKLVTFLSMGFELPLSVGSVALLVLVFRASVATVYWAQGLVTLFEAAVVAAIVGRSNWSACARDARRRQRASDGAGQEDVQSELQEGLAQGAHAGGGPPAEGQGRTSGES